MQEEANTSEYSYDGRGNLTGVLENDAMTAEYWYDATNMLVKAQNTHKGMEEYGYNGLRRRVLKQTGIQNPQAEVESRLDKATESVQYLVDLTKPYHNLLHTETDGSIAQNFIWGNELLASEGDISYTYLQDHLGTPIRLVEDEASNAPLACDEFGVHVVQAGKALHNPFGFTGYQQSEVNGLQYAQARYYDPHTSRMAAADIWQGVTHLPKSQNKYAHCYANPLTLVDRTGRFPTWNEIVEFVDENIIKPGGRAFVRGVDNAINTEFQKTENLVNAGLSLAGYDPTFELNTTIVGAAILDMNYNPETGTYHADFDCKQQYFGYNDFYDWVFDHFTYMDTEKFEFSMGDEDFIFWAWKGDYMNLGPGLEMGIYEHAFGPFWNVNKELAMPMSLTLYDLSGNKILGHYPGYEDWWGTGFNPDGIERDPQKLIATYTAFMADNQEMFEAFYAKFFDTDLGRPEDTRLIINPFAQTFTFTFMPRGMEDKCLS